MTLWSTIDGTNSERQVSDCFWITSEASWWPLWCDPKGTDHLCCFVRWWFVNQENKKYNMASSKSLSNLRWDLDFWGWFLHYSLHKINNFININCLILFFFFFFTSSLPRWYIFSIYIYFTVFCRLHKTGYVFKRDNQFIWTLLFYCFTDVKFTERLLTSRVNTDFWIHFLSPNYYSIIYLCPHFFFPKNRQMNKLLFFYSHLRRTRQSKLSL